MRENRWEKKRFTGSQLSGKTLGVVGLGRIGQEVARLAVAFGMNVLACDPDVTRDTADKIGVTLVDTLQELLGSCDYLTVHVPENEQTRGLIGAEEIALMKPDARVINGARGSVVDLGAVTAAVKGGRLGGAAFDVYEKEPPEDYEFARDDRIIATPHLGASTEEAQLAVAIQAAEQLADALRGGRFRNAVNADLMAPEELKVLEPYCDLAARLGKLVCGLNRGRPEALAVVCSGGLAGHDVGPLVNYALMGVMRWTLGVGVNIVSAPYLAQDRGIQVTSSQTPGQTGAFANMLEVMLRTDAGELRAAGTVFEGKLARIVRIGEFDVEIEPRGHVLIVFNADLPGCIGKVGTLLGEAGINVARMGVCRQQVGGNALLALNLDSPCDQAIIDKIKAYELIQDAVAIEL
jgi:D-3-phosphoglycerate dehydrogenase